MTKELLNAAILRLRSRATEHYGLIKLLYASPADENTVDKICDAALEMVKYEGAMLTLQQYSADIVGAAAPEQPVAPEPSLQEGPQGVGHNELMGRSPTYKKSVEAEKKKAARARKKKP